MLKCNCAHTLSRLKLLLLLLLLLESLLLSWHNSSNANHEESTENLFLNKVKCTVVQALRLCTGRTAHRGSRGTALLFLDHCARRRWGVSVTPRPLFTPGKAPVLIVHETGWTPRSVWTGAENLIPTGIRSQTVLPVASPYTDWATGPTWTRIARHQNDSFYWKTDFQFSIILWFFLFHAASRM